MRLDAIEQSRRQWTADPLIFRAGEIYKAFVYGRGINRPRLSKSIMATLAKPGEGTIEVEDAEPPLTGNAKKIDDLLTAIWNDPYHQVGRASSLHPRRGGSLEKREGRRDGSKKRN